MQKIYLSIDLGASSGRILMGTTNQNNMDTKEIYRFKNTLVQKGQYLCWNLEHIKKELLLGLRKASTYGNIESIGVDSWGVDFILKDKNQKQLMPSVSYRDHRTDGILDVFYQKENISKKTMYNKTGIQFLPFNSIYQLYSILQNYPEILPQIASFSMIADEINYFLSGIHAVEYTNASTTQMINMETKKWDSDILEILQLKEEQFSPLINPGCVLGTITDYIAKETGLNKSTKIITVASHDTASAIAAIDSTKGAYLSSGTWSIIGIESLTPIINDFTFDFSFSHEAGIDNTYRILKNIMGLWVISRIHDDSKDKRDIKEIAVLFTPNTPVLKYIDINNSCFANPTNMLHAIDSYLKKTDQSPVQNHNEYYQIIYQNLALSYAYYLDKIKQINSLEYLHIFGGGSLNNYLNQITANYSQTTVYAGPVEASCLGNFLVQMTALGEFSNISEARKWLATCLKFQKFEPQTINKDEIIQYNNTIQKYKELII